MRVERGSHFHCKWGVGDGERQERVRACRREISFLESEQNEGEIRCLSLPTLLENPARTTSVAEGGPKAAPHDL